MATAPTEESVLLFKLLQDGRWHSYPEIKDKIASRVPPGKASRAYEMRMEPERKRRGDPSYNTCHNEDDIIDFGKNDVAQGVVSSWVNRGVQSWGKRHRRIIRVEPGFDSYRLPAPAVPNPDDEYAPGALPPDSEPPEGVTRPEQPPRWLREAQKGQGVDSGTPKPSEAFLGPSPGAEEGFRPLLDERFGLDVEAERPPVAPEPQAGASVGDTDSAQPGAVDPDLVFDESTLIARAQDFVPALSSPSVTAGEGPAAGELCSECGLIVGDHEIHKRWHEDQAHARAVAEPLVERKIFEELLDQFQVNMQTWLLLQFAQLEAKIVGRKSTPAKWLRGGGDQR